MREHQHIDKMLRQGKLDTGQADLLKASLKASEDRKSRVGRTRSDEGEAHPAGRIRMVLGGIFMVLLVALFFSTGNRALFFFLLLVMVSLGCASAVFLLFFNILVWKREGIARTHALIANEVERKAALVPQIRETVSAYAAHESATFQKAIRERAAKTTGTIGESLDVGPASLSFQALSEQYPEIKSDRTYMQLFNQLVETENRITAMVKWYNDIARGYNGTLEAFPFSIVADAFSFKKTKYLESA